MAKPSVKRHSIFAATRGFAAASLACAMAMCSSPASAAILQWVNPSGGSAAIPSNWFPAQFPTASDQLIFPLSSAYSVTFNNGVPLSQTHIYSKGTVTLNMTSPHTTQTLIVNGAVADNPIVRLASGELAATVAVAVGTTSGSVGRLDVTNSLTELRPLVQMVVGSNGGGTLNVSNFGQVITPQFTAAQAATSSATINLNDLSLALQATNAVIGNSGDATMTLSDGGGAFVGSNMFLAANAASNSTVAINFGSELEINDNLYVGANQSGVAGGDGVIHVNLGGSMVIPFGDIHLADDPEGGTGTLHLNGGSVTTGGLLCGSGATLDLDEGVLAITDVLVPPNGVLSFASSTNGTPLLHLIDASMTAAAPTATQNAINIGSGGELRLATGSQVDATLGNVHLDASTGAPATLTAVNGSSLDAAGTVVVGALGSGAVLLDSTAQLEAGNLFIASQPGSSGTVEVFGGADVDVFGLVRVGGQASIAGGTGMLNVQHDNSSITVNSPGNSTLVHPNGTLYVGVDAVYTNAATLSNLGLIIVEGGIINTSFLSVTGDVIAHGAINGNLIINIQGQVTASGGPLTLGNPGSTVGFQGIGGSLDVGGEVVTLADSNGALLGNTTINNGTLNLPDGSTLGALTTLSGAGTINGDVTNNGGIDAIGTGLGFGGILTSENHAVGGTMIRFLSTGGFTGRGSIAAAVDADAGSIITATSDLTMGDGTANGIVLDGTLHVGDHFVTLLDSTNVTLGSLTTLTSGTLEHPAGLTLSNIPTPRILRGVGDVDAMLTNGGVVEPGQSGEGSNSPGTLNVGGVYIQHFSGDLKIDIGALAHDNLVVQSLAILGGDLFVNLIDGFVPANNQEFTIITGSPVSGTFNSVTLGGAPPSLTAQVIYASNSVKIRFVTGSCPPDINGSGAVDVDDLIAVILGWGPCDPPPAACAPDIDDSGAVDVDDLIAVILGWGACR